MRLRRVAALMLRQLYLLRGSPARLVPLFAWVAVDVVLWGYITRFLNQVASAGFDFVPALLGAVLLWDFNVRVMQGVTMGFFEDVWARNFLNLFASPLSVGEYLLGLIASSIVTSLIGLVVMVGVAKLAFGLSLLVYGTALVGFFAVLFLFGIALGIWGAAIVLRLGPAAEWLVWPIPALLSPFAGVFYPVAVLPLWMRAVAWALPPSYVFEAMRSIVAGHVPDASLLAWGIATAVVHVVVAVIGFTWIHRYAVRTVLLARYSAESVS